MAMWNIVFIAGGVMRLKLCVLSRFHRRNDQGVSMPFEGGFRSKETWLIGICGVHNITRASLHPRTSLNHIQPPSTPITFFLILITLP
jgi:hypothetical protein